MITLTKRAADEIKRIQKEQNLGDSVYFRVSIKGGGCNGFTYDVRFDPRKTVIDDEFLSEDVKMLVDKKSHIYLDGTQIDYEVSLMQRGFVFHNPKAKNRCGCGVSFNV
jgi:iron-sulfur cluster assembly accessory protein